jgi:hypothetical protein
MLRPLVGGRPLYGGGRRAAAGAAGTSGCTSKDGNPLNEVEMLADPLMNNNGISRGSNVITLVPEQSVLELHIGDPIRLDAERFERLSAAFLADLEGTFR